MNSDGLAAGRHRHGRGWPLWGWPLFDALAFYVSKICWPLWGWRGCGCVCAYASVSVADPPPPSVPPPSVSVSGGPIFMRTHFLKPVSAGGPRAGGPPCWRARLPGARPQDVRTPAGNCCTDIRYFVRRPGPGREVIGQAMPGIFCQNFRVPGRYTLNTLGASGIP